MPKLSIDKEETTYTLVLDLDETLIHFTQGHEIYNRELNSPKVNDSGSGEGQFLFRPFMLEFLAELS